MKSRALAPFIAFLLLSLAEGASAQFYVAYEAGLAAAKVGNWQTVIQKMNEAIAKNSTENNKARTYGTQFINYHPYYYRGAAYVNIGKYEQAIDDLDKATGIGPENLGSIESLHQRAEAGAKTASPEPEPAPSKPAPREPSPPPVQPPVNNPPPVRVTPPPVQTQPGPTSDPLLDSARSQALSMINQAKARNQAAIKARAATTAAAEFQRGSSFLSNAQSRQGFARTAADWRQVSDLASQANGSFDASITIAQNAALTQKTLPAKATEDILSTPKSRIIAAVESFYLGDYDDATSRFQTLSQENPKNPMIWAFLGASQYSEWTLNGDQKPGLKEDAVESFKQARKLKSSFKLPDRYFSPRIRRFFEKSAG